MSTLVSLVGWLSIAQAGGGPANVLVLYNDQDEQAEELAEYYRLAREIPAGHLCPISDVDPSAGTISFEDYDATIRVAIDNCLATHPQPDEIHTLVLTRGLPYRIDIEEGFSTSLGAMLQVGDTTRRTDGTPLAGTPQEKTLFGTWTASIQNPVWTNPGSEAAYTVENPYSTHYRSTPHVVEDDIQPRSFSRRDMDYGSTWDFSTGLFLVSRLDGFDYSDGFDLVDRALLAETSVPEAPITCMAAADEARGARDPECAYTIEMLDAVGIPAQWLSPHDAALADTEMSAYLTGTTNLKDAIDGNTYAPGAFACNLTSTGAYPQNFYCDETGETCPESEAQTSIARLVRGGVTGAHGTVAEPLNNTFPGAAMLLLYTMGYNMAESALFAQHYLYWQNLYLGDPLTSPWAERPVVTVDTSAPHPANAPLVVTAEHADGISEIALYLDGHRVTSVLETDTLSYALEDDLSALGLTPPVTVELLVIATADNATIARPGWPSGETEVRADVQGWTTLTVDVGLPEELPAPDDTGQSDTGQGDTGSPSPDDTGTSGDEPADPAASDTGAANDADDDKAGCGCATTGAASGLWWVLAGLWVWPRRRR